MNDRHLSGGFDEVVEQAAIRQGVRGGRLWNARIACVVGE